MNLSSLGAAGFQRPDPATLFKKADADNSGGISKDELTTMIENGPQGPNGTPNVDEIFSKADADADGQISETENKAFMETMRKDGPKGPPPPKGGMSGSTDSFQALIKALKDAVQVTEDEQASSEAESEAKTSASNSGDKTTITKEDLTKLLQQFVEQMKQQGGQTNLFSAKA